MTGNNSELFSKGESSKYIDDYRTHNEFDNDNIFKKSSRSCKGKRYQEIMKSISKNGSPSKRLKIKENSNTSIISVQSSYTQYDGNIGMEIDIKDGSSSDEIKEAEKKIFDASDFDLEEKIKALPPLSLEDYLVRKRETKKTKKKIGGKLILILILIFKNIL